VILVGQQDKRQIFLGFELGLILDRIGADADYDGISGLILGEIVTDPLRLRRSATGHGLGEKVEHDSFSFEIT
jgi:hypothetical protein